MEDGSTRLRINPENDFTNGVCFGGNTGGPDVGAVFLVTGDSPRTSLGVGTLTPVGRIEAVGGIRYVS